MLLLHAAPPALAEEAPQPEGAVIRAVVKLIEGGKVTLKIVQVDRRNDHARFEKMAGKDLTLPADSLRNAPAGSIVRDALLTVRMTQGTQGGEVLDAKAPGSYPADEARVVEERPTKLRVTVTEEMHEPQHLFITKVLSIDLGDFEECWGNMKEGDPYAIPPDSLEGSVRGALAVGTEMEVELGPKGPIAEKVLSGGVKETKWKGIALGIGGVVSLLVLLYVWIVLRKKLLEG